MAQHRLARRDWASLRIWIKTLIQMFLWYRNLFSSNSCCDIGDYIKRTLPIKTTPWVVHMDDETLAVTWVISTAPSIIQKKIIDETSLNIKVFSCRTIWFWQLIREFTCCYRKPCLDSFTSCKKLQNVFNTEKTRANVPHEARISAV